MVKLHSHPISSRDQENPLVSIKCVFCFENQKQKCVFVCFGECCCDAVYSLHDVETGDCLRNLSHRMESERVWLRSFLLCRTVSVLSFSFEIRKYFSKTLYQTFINMLWSGVGTSALFIQWQEKKTGRKIKAKIICF